MSPEVSAVNRIILASEEPALESFARQQCAVLFPDLEITTTSLEAFAEGLQQTGDPEELRVLAVHADTDGHLLPGASLVQQLLTSRVPVLILRQPAGESGMPAPFTRVVVPLDGSSTAGQAIPVASRVAQLYNLPVKFVMVIDPSRVIPPAYAYDPEAWGVIEELRVTAHWALGQAETTMRQDGVRVSSDLLLGSINASLMASIQDGDLVVMATHGLDRRNLRYRDSVAKRVLVSIPQPILIMQAGEEPAVVVGGYQACGWAEPLKQEPAPTA